MSDGFDLNLDYEGSSDEFYIDFKRVANTTDLLPVVRLTALNLSENPYISVGEWIQGLNDLSLREAQEMSEATLEGDDCNPELLEQLMLLTLMLASAEGTLGSSRDLDRMGEQMAILRNLITITSLERKGLVTCRFENFTLGDDMGDKIIVEKK